MTKGGREGVGGRNPRAKVAAFSLPVRMDDLGFHRAREPKHKHLLGSKENAGE